MLEKDLDGQPEQKREEFQGEEELMATPDKRGKAKGDKRLVLGDTNKSSLRDIAEELIKQAKLQREEKERRELEAPNEPSTRNDVEASEPGRASRASSVTDKAPFEPEAAHRWVPEEETPATDVRKNDEYQPPEIDDWEPFLQLFGKELIRRIDEDGLRPDLSDCVSHVGAQFFSDRADLAWFEDEALEILVDLPSEILIQRSWGEGSAAVVKVEIGEGQEFIAMAPDGYGPDGLWWGIIAIFDAADDDLTRSAALDNIAYDAGFAETGIPMFYKFAAPITRDDLFYTYSSSLDTHRMWEVVAAWVEQVNGESLPFGTEEEKDALLDEYLDLVIEAPSAG